MVEDNKLLTGVLIEKKNGSAQIDNGPWQSVHDAAYSSARVNVRDSIDNYFSEISAVSVREIHG